MKGILLLLTAAFLLSLSSCGQKGEDEISISLSPSSSFVVPGDDSTCGGTSVSGPRISYRKLNVTWKVNQPLYIVNINLKFIGGGLSGGTYRCDINGKELNALFANNADFNKGEVSPASAGNIELTSDACAITCGGVSVSDENVAFRASGMAKLVGYTVDSDGNQRPIKAQTQVFLEYLPY